MWKEGTSVKQLEPYMMGSGGVYSYYKLTGCSEEVQLYDTLCSIIPTYLPFRDFIPASLYVVEVIVFSTIHESPPPQIIQQATRRS